MSHAKDVIERVLVTGLSAFIAAAFIGSSLDWKAGTIAAGAAILETIKSVLALGVSGTISPASIVKEPTNG